MVDVLNNIRAAYHILADRVSNALLTQVGDATRLGAIRAQATSLSVAAEQVCRLLYCFNSEVKIWLTGNSASGCVPTCQIPYTADQHYHNG